MEEKRSEQTDIEIVTASEEKASKLEARVSTIAKKLLGFYHDKGGTENIRPETASPASHPSYFEGIYPNSFLLDILKAVDPSEIKDLNLREKDFSGLKLFALAEYAISRNRSFFGMLLMAIVAESLSITEKEPIGITSGTYKDIHLAKGYKLLNVGAIDDREPFWVVETGEFPNYETDEVEIGGTYCSCRNESCEAFIYAPREGRKNVKVFIKLEEAKINGEQVMLQVVYCPCCKARTFIAKD